MSQYNNMLILQEISNNEESVKVMKDELRFNFRFHNNTGVRNSFCDGQYPELLVVFTVFPENNDSGVILSLICVSHPARRPVRS